MAKKKASTPAVTETPSEFEIESGIPIPERKKRQSKYPFSRLEVGDSFFVPGKTAVKFAGTAYLTSKKAGVRCRVWDDEKDGVTGVRVGRIA